MFSFEKILRKKIQKKIIFSYLVTYEKKSNIIKIS